MYSGGADSEVLAIGLLELGIPFEAYSLNNWQLNKDTFSNHIIPFVKKHGIRLNVLDLESEYFKEEYIYKSYDLIGCEKPTYLAMTYLFSRVPTSQFLLCGEGDLDKHGESYNKLWQKSKFNKPQFTKKFILPFSNSEIAYRIWAQKNERYGQYYFYSSTPELIAASLSHPAFIYNQPFANTKKMMAIEFPEVPFRPKTTNWEGGGAVHNKEIRERIQLYAKNNNQLSFWEPNIGTFTDLSHFYFNHKLKKNRVH